MYNSFGKYKTTSRVQIFLGLFLACCFILCSSSHITNADVSGLYPIKTDNTLGYNFNNRIDQGFSSAQMVYSQFQTSREPNYFNHVFDCVDVALGNAESYFSFDFTVTNYNKSTYIDYFLTYDDEYSFNREYFLNVYLCVDSENNAYIFCQYNKGYNGFADSTLSYYNYRDTDFIPVYNLISSVSFWYPTIENDTLVNDIIYVPNNYTPFSNSTSANGFYFLPLGFSNTNNLASPNLKPISSTNYTPNAGVNNIKANVNYNWFFMANPSQNSINVRYALKFDYILPLYIDSNIYTPTSFISPIGDNININSRLIDWSSGTSLVYYPYRSAADYPQYFSPNLWYTSSFRSGILQSSNNPDPILTPIPSFGPIYSPTPFPTINISATLTPIAIPNDPYINVGNADPISTIVGIFSYLMTMFATPFFGFVKYTLQYIYNSSVYWQILLFLIPGVVLIAFLIGRLKRK